MNQSRELLSLLAPHRGQASRVDLRSSSIPRESLRFRRSSLRTFGTFNAEGHKVEEVEDPPFPSSQGDKALLLAVPGQPALTPGLSRSKGHGK